MATGTLQAAVLALDLADTTDSPGEEIVGMMRPSLAGPRLENPAIEFGFPPRALTVAPTEITFLDEDGAATVVSPGP